MDESPTGGRNIFYNKRIFLLTFSAWMNPRQGVETNEIKVGFLVNLSMDESPTGGRNYSLTAQYRWPPLSMDESPTGGRNFHDSRLLL